MDSDPPELRSEATVQRKWQISSNIRTQLPDTFPFQGGGSTSKHQYPRTGHLSGPAQPSLFSVTRVQNITTTVRGHFMGLWGDTNT